MCLALFENFFPTSTSTSTTHSLTALLLPRNMLKAIRQSAHLHRQCSSSILMMSKSSSMLPASTQLFGRKMMSSSSSSSSPTSTPPPTPASSILNEDQREGTRSHIHFKLSPKGKALTPNNLSEDDCELAAGDHTGRQQVEARQSSESTKPHSTSTESYLDESRAG